METKIRSIKYPFGVDQGLKTWAEESEYRLHIIQMIKQVLLTNPGERINRPDFGCEIRRMLFAVAEGARRSGGPPHDEEARHVEIVPAFHELARHEQVASLIGPHLHALLQRKCARPQEQVHF